MLHDNLPTNIFSISELTSFGYTRYSHSCPARQFARQLNADSLSKAPSRSRPSSSSTHHHRQSSNHSQQDHHDPFADSTFAHQESDPLLAAYSSLLTARIPCHWRYSDRENPSSVARRRSNTLERELWVFWLNDKSVLQDHGLDKLQECQSGNMTWDSILQSNNPASSTGTPQTPKPGTADPPNAALEYEVFIRGLRNVLDRGMVAKGGYRLGSSYVFPASLQPRLDGSILPNFPEMPSMTMLSCIVSMYLSLTNLIFQPTFQHHRLRVLEAADLDPRHSPDKELKVLISPHGTSGVLRLRDMAEFTDDQTQHCLDSWADHFGTNQDLVNEISRSLPRLVAVSVTSGQNEVVLQCPTERVFVPVSCKESPSDVGQLDGMGSRNLGFIEDLGAKFAIWSWQEKTRNAIASPAVPKLVQPVSDHTPILAEPRNRLKAGSSAWQQQQLQQQQQALQQQQQQQQQQQSQNFFLQQQQDALVKRTSNVFTYDTNRIDYWSYTDPYAYLTSIVLNSCANVEPKGADSPSEADNQASIVVPMTPIAKPTRSRLVPTKSTTGSKEADGWIRVRPRRNTVASPSIHNFGTMDTPDTNQAAWTNGLDSSSMPASENESSLNNATQFNTNTPNDPTQPDAQNAGVTNSSYNMPIDLPADNNDMMSMMDMNSMMGMYGAGSSDDLEDWGVVTKDDFSFFDEQPRSAPAPRALPMAPAVSFDALQSSIPMTSAALGIIPGVSTAISSTIPTTNGVISSFPDGMMTASPIDDDSLLENMDLDLSSFGNMASPSTAILPPGGTTDRLVAIPTSTIDMSPLGDQLLPNQTGLDVNMQTPTPQPDKELNHADPQHQHQHQPPALPTPTQLLISTSESALVKRSSILVTHLNSPIHSFIPSSFSPLKIVGDDLVDDSKYKAGGRFAYRRLYKRRKSSIPDPFNLYRRESKMLPFYQPGKHQEWIMPVRKEKQRRKARSQPFTVAFNWNAFKSGGSSTNSPQVDMQLVQQKPGTTRPGTLIRSTSTPVTAWGLASYPLQSYSKRKKGDESTSGESDSDSSSASSTDDSDDDSSVASSNIRPQFGRFSRRRGDDGSFGEHGEGWTVRGVNSAKFMASILDKAMDTSAGNALLGLDSTTQPTVSGRTKAWKTADAYHSEVEFDTPFTPVIFSAAPPALVDEPLMVQESLASEYFLEAVKTLCEQAVLGDYPFAGSNEVTGTSGEITEGESFHVMLARRKILSQQLNDGVATVPILGDESFRNVMEIKTVIFDLLDRLRGNPSDDTVALPVPSEAAQEMGMGMTTLHGHHHHSSQGNIVPPVIMKGPLTLLQYFTLGEAQQMPSKYGKYQVKKKKTAEPALMQLQPPDIVVGHNEEWLEASPTILRFWEKLSLGPYSNRKSIAYFVVYPESVDMENNVTRFWRELSVVFETSLLGKHQPGSLQDYKPGLVPIPLLPGLAGESMEARQVRSYIDGCQRLGSLLGGNSMDKDIHTVIYMVNPFPHGAGYFDLCRCFSIMKTQFRTAAMGSLLSPLEQQRERLVLQIVPIQHVVNPSTFGGYLLFGLKDIAFTVYAKCKLFLERATYTREVLSQINAYAPLFALAKTTPPTINFDVHQKPNSMPKPPATLHVGYGFSLDGRWLICVWTDHRGELLEHLALDMTDNTSRMLMSGKFANVNGGHGSRDYHGRSLPLLAGMKEIWNRTLVYQKRGSFTWKTVISKLGLMTRTELQEWTRLTAGTNYTAVVAVNIDSAMRMYPHNRGAEYLSSGMTPSTSGVNTPTNPGGGLGVGTPLLGSNSMLSTPLSQSMVPNITTSSTATSTPDVMTAPTTPLNFGNAAGNNGGLNNAGTTGLGIAGAGGGPSASVGGMAGIGGVSGHETLENSAGQVYAMILNHRIPLIVSQQESGLSRAGGGGRSQPGNQMDTNDVKPIMGAKEEPEEGEYDSKDIQLEDSIMTTPLADLDQDQDMEPQIKQEETSGRHVLLKAESIGKGRERALEQSTALPVPTRGNDVIVPLSSGYLIQVPIQSNSVMREKHALEALGVEVHLLHLQRIPTSTPAPTTAPKPAQVSSSPRRPMTGKEQLAAYRPSSNPMAHYQLARSTAYQMNRIPPLSPIGPKYVPYRPSNFVLPHYRPQPSSSVASPTSSTSTKSLLNQSPGGPANKGGGSAETGEPGSGTGAVGGGSGSGTASSGSGGELGGGDKGGEKGGGEKGTTAAAGSTAVKGTVAASTTREILKQFHALSYLSQAPVQTNCLPNHLVLVERLSRVLLLVRE